MFSTHVNEILLESFAQIVDEGGLTAKVFQQNEVLNANSITLVQSSFHVPRQFLMLEDFRSRTRFSEDTPSVNCLCAANIPKNERLLNAFQYIISFPVTIYNPISITL